MTSFSGLTLLLALAGLWVGLLPDNSTTSSTTTKSRRE